MAHDSQTSSAYAQALLALATDQRQAEPMAVELGEVAGLIDRDPSLGEFLRSPSIARKDRAASLQKAFSGRVSPLLLNFLGVLNKRNRVGLLPDIAREYRTQLDRQLGNIGVEVRVARALDQSLLDEVTQSVSKALKKNANVHQVVDDSIIGGMILRVEDKLIDASVRGQLQAMRRTLAIPKA